MPGFWQRAPSKSDDAVGMENEDPWPVDNTQPHDASSLWSPGEPAATEPEKSSTPKGRFAKTAAAILVLLGVSVGSGVVGATIATNDNDSASITARPVSVAESSTTPTQQLSKVAEAVQPSVVSITVTSRTAQDEGSGVILSDDGTILTNNHVVSAAATSGNITVKFANGKTAAAKIVGRDPSSDIAVIKASGVSGLTVATLGSTSTLHVGDTVLAIGSPLGLDGSVTSGIISALHRTVDLTGEAEQDPSQGGLFGQRSQARVQSTSVGDAIQTDAAINPGNSGGALVDINGAVVGINTAIASTGSTNGNIGVGFAIPIEEAKSVAETLIRGETPKHALLGVEIDDQTSGAVVADVTTDGAANKGGIEVGDIITKVDNTNIEDGTSLAAKIRAHQPGDKVTITYTRDGKEKTTEVTLGAAAA